MPTIRCVEATPAAGSAPAPSVSVIIPAYNTAPYIAEALDSVLAQTFRDFEIIVINDGSPDTEELERVLAPYRSRITYIEQENRGSSAARNAGLRIARGRYVAMLDSDDLWEPDYLAMHVQTLEEDPSIDVVFPNARLFGIGVQEGLTYMDMFPLEGEVTHLRVLAGECRVWGGVTARRDTIAALGGYDESLGSAEDLDLWLRVLRRGGRITYHRRVLAHYRQREGSHTSDAAWLYENYLKLLERVRERNPGSEPVQTLVEEQSREAQAWFRRIEGKRAFLEGDIPLAIRELSAARTLSGSRKLMLVVALLRVAPWVLRLAYRLRARLSGDGYEAVPRAG
jgi:GT2 family glycosyltransferase